MRTKLGGWSAVGSGIAAMMLMLAGTACQTYRRAPLDLESHRARWAGRSTDTHEVRELALRLAESRPVDDRHFAVGDGLSLAEAEAVATLYNADLRLARLRSALAAASARHAGLWEDPVFGFDAERILNDVQHPWIAAASLGFTLPFSGRLEAEKRTACAEERAAVARVVADEWAVRVRLRALWLRWSYQALRADLTRTLLDRLGSIAAVAGRLEEAGELSRIEGRLFRAELASRRVELRTVETRRRELELEIKHVMGLVPEAPVELVPQTADFAGGADPRSFVEHSPQMSALRAAYEVAEEALRLEIRKQYPDLGIAPGLKEEDGDARVTLGLELPLPFWNRNQRAIAEARARRELARAEFETGYEALVARVASAELQRETAAAQRSELESSLIPLIDEQSREVQRVAELGEVNTLLMLDTLVRQHEAKLKLIDARLEEALASVRLRELTGPARPSGEVSP